MRLVLAEGPLLDQIFDLTYPVWHEGLSRRAYAAWNVAQMRTGWKACRLARLALVADDGRLLASLKRYRFDVRVDGRDGWMCGLGAIFTPPELRGRGYATALVERVLDEERRAGALLAGLFSEIGPDFYRRLGFEPVPFDEVTVAVERRGGAPALLVRAGDERDLPALTAMHEARAAGAAFALRRDVETIRFALAKKRLFAGLSEPGTRQVEFFVAEEGASAVAYVLLTMNPYGWTLEEAGDRDPAAARLGAILQVLLAREPARRPPLFRAWWPAVFPVPPQVTLTDRGTARDLFMVRPLAGATVPRRADEVFYWRSDYF
ncbi:MAG TPA: GNAT family N-acetyltransferase [Vicinamibacterales bacterium]|nr:GNAT family N-acetyltransferase [Vicinamibacterales bacterium]